MSKSFNSRVTMLKDLEVQLRGNTTQSGVVGEDALTYARAIVLQVAYFTDLPLEGISTNWGTWSRWANEIASTPPLIVGKLIKDLQLSTRNIPVGVEVSYIDFKRRSVFPSLVGAFLAPIRDVVLQFLTQRTPGSFDILNRFLAFLSRLNLPSLDYSKEAESDWMECERKLGELTLPSSLLCSLNAIIREWMEGWEPPSLQDFQHGPGGVAELKRASKLIKYQNLKSDTLMNYCSPDCWDRGSVGRTNEIVFVPKSMTTWRTISMEPVSLQWFQQGVWRSLARHMGTHSTLRRIIPLRDQSLNRHLAQQGSFDPVKFATVDLSAASDTVSWNLVKAMFTGTGILRYLFASRSRQSLLPGGTTVTIHKFAPMGSALCFPIECLVFASCCEHVRRSLAKTETFSVFGDDIIVPSSWTPDLYQVLETLGFTINKQKSFRAANLPFRESCGGEYYFGVDVTPFRLPRNFRYVTGWNLVKSPSSYASYVELCNTFNMLGSRFPRKLILDDLLGLPKPYRPLFDDGRVGICSPDPDNRHLTQSYHKDWQTRLARHGFVDSLSQGEDEDDLRYYEDRRVERRTPTRLEMLFEKPSNVSLVARRERVARVFSHLD